MTILHTLIAFMTVLAVLIIVHELGHYWVARWCRVKVLRFSVGMGKVIYSRRLGPDQTEWAISILPFGGYVKMLDEREQDVSGLTPEDLKREFTRQPVFKRFAIVAAGPLANFLLAIAIFTGLHINGMPEPIPKLRDVPQPSAAFQAGLRGGELITAINGDSIRVWSDLRWKMMQLAIEKAPARLDIQRPDSLAADSKPHTSVMLSLDSLSTQDLEGDFLGKLGLDLARPKAILGQISPGSPAMRADLREGDWIQQINGIPVRDGLALIESVRVSAGKPLRMTIRRAQEELSIVVIPESQEQNGQTVGKIGAAVPVAPEMLSASDPPLTAVAKAVRRTWDTSTLTLKMLGRMLVGELSWKNITGPITIADYAGQTARIGIISYLSFIAYISISLGVMNLLPIPVLDGGLLLYYSLEVLTGRPVSRRFNDIAQRAGLGILAALMLVAIVNDIVRLMN